MGPEDRIVAVLPFFHIYGMTVLMNVALRKGATVVVLPRFDLAQFIDVLEKHRITRAYVAPPVVLAMAKHPAFGGRDFSALEFILSAAAPLDGELAAAAAERMGAEIGQAYGMTELSPGTHLVPDGLGAQAPSASIGKLFPVHRGAAGGHRDRRGRRHRRARRDLDPRPAADEGLLRPPGGDRHPHRRRRLAAHRRHRHGRRRTAGGTSSTGSRS